MNRLILVGNGFDLAHGLKTSYKDFILWYLADCFLKADIYGKLSYEDLVIKCTRGDYYYSSHLLVHKSIEQLINEYYENGTLNELLSYSNDTYVPDVLFMSSDSRHERYPSNENYLFKAYIKSTFLCNVFKNCIDSDWVDVEIEYFESLKDCKKNDGSFNVKQVLELNNQFEYFKSKLQEYLGVQEKEHKAQVNPRLLELLSARYEIEDFDTVIDDETLKKKLGYDHTVNRTPTHSVYILNFNYTHTTLNYKDSIRSYFSKVEINHIHGELNNPTNPIVFGFGDEYDKDYLNFEEQKNNDIFKHIKSYQYFKTPNYRNLVRFLNDGDFQVYVMGHSCGLSDRTMFKEIFEHENCKSVKIFHYESSPGVNDFWEKTVNLGRHFSDKGRMRKLIVEFNEANAFPQCN